MANQLSYAASPAPGPSSYHHQFPPAPSRPEHRRQRSNSLPTSAPLLATTTTTTTVTTFSAKESDLDIDIELHYSLFPIMPASRSKAAAAAAIAAAASPSSMESSSNRKPSSKPPSLKKSRSFSQRLMQSLVVGPSFVAPPPVPSLPPPPLAPKDRTPNPYHLEVKLVDSDAFKPLVNPSSLSSSSSSSTPLPRPMPPPPPAGRKAQRSPFELKPPRPPIGKSKLNISFTTLLPARPPPVAARPSSPPSQLSPTSSLTKKYKGKRLERRPLYQQCLLIVFARTPHGDLIIAKGAGKGIKLYQDQEVERRLKHIDVETDAQTVKRLRWAVPADEDEGGVERKKAKGWKNVFKAGKVIWAHVQDGLADDVAMANARPLMARGQTWVAAM